MSAFTLAILLLASPLAPVFAQEATSQTSSGSEQTTSTTQVSEATTATPETTSEKTSSDTVDTSKMSPQELIDYNQSLKYTHPEQFQKEALPEDDSSAPAQKKRLGDESEAQARSGSGTDPDGNQRDAYLSPLQRANLQPMVSDNTGALQYSYPIQVPPGRNNLTPSVNLIYNSQYQRDDSEIGYGWRFDIPYIERSNKHGSPDLYSSSYKDYYSTLDSDLAFVSGSTYAPVVEKGDFRKYSLSSNVWTVTDKSGTVYTFGAAASSRQDDSANTSHIFRWYLTTVTDANGNTIDYTYYKDAGQIYPSTISYGGIYSINFTRTSISTPALETYNAGFKVKTNYRISLVETQISSSWVSRVALGSTTGINGTRTLLSSITEKAKDPSSGSEVSQPAINLTYQLAAQSSASTGTTPEMQHGTATWSANLGLDFRSNGTVYNALVDVNNDNLPDILYSDGTKDSTQLWPQVHLNNGNGTWSYNSSWTFPTIYTNPTTGEHITLSLDKVQFADINGDGLMDIITGYDGYLGNSPSATKVLINNGSGWDYNSSWDFPATDSSGNYTATFAQNAGSGVTANPTVFIDVNGDGLTDVVSATGCQGTSCTYRSSVFINTGSGWSQPSGWQLPTISSLSSPYNVMNFARVYGSSYIVDINGDGLPDLYDPTYGLYKNTGSGWTYDSSWDMTNVPINDTQFGDFNNDGLVDFVRANALRAGSWVYLNTGSGWTKTTSSDWDMPETHVSACSDSLTYSFIYGSLGCSTYSDGNARSIDANADGILDIVNGETAGKGVYIIQGHAHVKDTTTPGYDIPSEYFSSRYGDTARPYELNGDNVMDYVYAYNGNSNNYTKIIAGKRSDVLSTISSRGVTTTIDYGTQALVGKQRIPNGIREYSPYVVKKITVTPDVGSNEVTDYTYTNGRDYFSADTGRRSAGFQTVTKVDPSGKTVTYYHQGDGNDSSSYETGDAYAKLGLPYRTEKYDASNNLYARSITNWDVYNIATGRDYVRDTKDVSMQYDGTSTHTDTATEYAYSNTDGTLTTKTEWGKVTAAADGTFTDTGSDKRITNYEYASNGTTGVIVPKHMTVTDASSTKVKEQKYYYDSSSYGTVSLGNQTKVEDWKTGSTYVNSQKAYNSYGLVSSSTDPRGKVTSYSYDTANLYPATVTDALSNATSYTYNYLTGRVATTTDQNGYVWTTTYDGFGRPLEIKIPDPAGSTTQMTKTVYVYTDTSGALSIKTTQNLDSSNGVDSYKYMDGRGRVLQERTENESSFIAKDYVYDTAGNLQKESLPYVSSGSSKTSPTTTTTLYSTYTYDPLGRILTDVNNVGTTSYTYAGFKTTVTDPRSKTKDLYKDAYGNLVQVDEHNSSSTYTTTYGRNLVGDVISITDALGNIRNFTYDGLGRRTAAEDLHASGDSTYGSWSYTYDDSGNMTQSVSPEAKTVNYTYDDTNRPLTENYTGASGTEITYAYDSCTNGVGRMCSVSMTGGADTAYTYDKDGNTASETKTVNSHAYTTSYTYDRQGNQLVITYPDSAQVKYTYNNGGLLEKVERKESGGSYTDVVSNFDYSPMNQITVQADANGVTTTNTYDATKLYRLTSRISDPGSGGSAMSAKVLVVGGGGGGGGVTAYTGGGGGGAGGYNYNATLSIAAQAYTITIGAGGNGGADTGTNGSDGGSSSFGSLMTAAGGGGGGGSASSYKNGRSGANGGGGASAAGSAGSGTQHNGGAGGSNGNASGAGGGGANANGGNGANGGPGGAGGDGIANSITGTSVYYAGGGGGSSSYSWSYGGGAGGGGSPGAGSSYANGTNGLGGGGSPLGGGNSDYAGGNGGSGVVIIAYHTDGSDGISTSSTGGTVTTSGGYTIHKFTSSGTFTAVYNSGAHNYLQDLSYTYDANGNITQLIDATNSHSSKTVAYVYDDLNRMTSATATAVASGQSTYTHTYTYNAIGNITSGPLGTYVYGGSSGSNYANPHAPTSVNSVTNTYDKDGNNLTDGTLTNTWNYKDQLTQTVKSSTTVNYLYDHSGNRVSFSDGTTTTDYANKYYNYNGTKKTKQIYAGDQLIATVEKIGSTVSPYYVHTDNLLGSGVISDSMGAKNQLLDYYPFGSVRLNEQATSFNEQKQFIGQEYDGNTGLNYLQARYYDSNKGQFISQDPEFWSLKQDWLLDPQNQNSYSYARNNPITLSDPSGKSAIGNILQNIKNVLNNLLSSKPITYQAPVAAPVAVQQPPKPEPVKTTTWDPVTDQRIAQLDPRLQQPAINFINNTESELNVQLRVNEGYRSVSRQNELYQQGRTTPGNIVTNAKGGESYHNYGLAMDVVIMENGQPNWKKPITQDIANIGTQQGFSWGGSWSGFKDYPHFEMTFGQTLSSLMKNLKQ